MLPKCRNKQLIFKNRVVQVVLLIFIHRKMVELRAGYPTSKTFTYMIYHHTNVITKSLLTAQNVCKSKLCSTGEGRSDMQQFDLLVDHGDVRTELRLRVCTWAVKIFARASYVQPEREAVTCNNLICWSTTETSGRN
jgi:hypothetical protein